VLLLSPIGCAASDSSRDAGTVRSSPGGSTFTLHSWLDVQDHLLEDHGYVGMRLNAAKDGVVLYWLPGSSPGPGSEQAMARLHEAGIAVEHVTSSATLGQIRQEADRLIGPQPNGLSIYSSGPGGDHQSRRRRRLDLRSAARRC
jgi:hypothetical protein